eukprot:gnl/TRDRNA2_/TRDRNA2_92234_c0_seq1.p1 gnl/TRDRNA2_/TRDRNA2_92234_c0~~gnl/TRDRNA2_/TRDRNA2_92234_c0_seq1.p1  ORF type:complete len:707 (-),score=121.10 gnl/TRDRNA2_/TRDRNA2_92234_c0_seq1:30-2150(-)
MVRRDDALLLRSLILVSLLVFVAVCDDAEQQCSASAGDEQGSSLLQEAVSRLSCPSRRQPGKSAADMSPEAVQERADGDALDCLFSHLYPDKVKREAVDPSRPREMTYGELLPVSLAKLFGGRGLFGVAAGADDAFVDLGSGTGKLPIQAFLAGLRSSVGIELDGDRHAFGAQAVESLRALLPQNCFASEGLPGSNSEGRSELRYAERLASLQQGDLLALPVENASIVFAASLCFPNELLQALADKLRRELQPGAVFWTLRELPAGTRPGLALVTKAYVASTWSDHAHVYIYTRVPDIVLPMPAEPPTTPTARSSWAASCVDAVQKEFARLTGDNSGATTSLGEGDLARFAESLCPGSPTRGSRLARAFAKKRSSADGDRCGCRRAGTEEWSFELVDMVEMLTHATFPPKEWDLACFSGGSICTVGDAFLDDVFSAVRKFTKCQQQRSQGRCSLSGPMTMPGLECMASSDGKMLLHRAIYTGQAEVASFALDRAGSSSFLCADYEGRTAVHLAAGHSNPKVTEWLLRAVTDGKADAEALSSIDSMGRSLLIAVSEASTLKSLIAAGAPKSLVNVTDASGSTPLHTAISRGKEDLAVALLEIGANASATGSVHTCPLAAAARNKDAVGGRLVELLVAHRAEVNTHYDLTRSTPLHVAAGKGAYAAVEALLKFRAEVGARSAANFTALDLTRGEEVKALLQSAMGVAS